jgi:uncharacterized membrane protein YjgN (DUF898 family)
MENENSELKEYKLSFNGQGKVFFGIVIVNWLLTLLTLSIYYPWAKARSLKYIYGSTSFNKEMFTFHGTGKEMFGGFIKIVLFLAIIVGLSFLFFYLDLPIIGALIFYFSVISFIPVVMHGSYRYRFSHTSWRGIRFEYRGERNELFVGFFKWIFFTIITYGIYGSWMVIKLRGYFMNNLRAGNVEFKYRGKTSDYFILNLKGYLLSLMTLGIYGFWWKKDRFAYYIDNLSLYKEGQQIRLKSTATAGDFFKLDVVNILLFIFTLGLGYAWIATRNMNFVTGKITFEGNMDMDTIKQTVEDHNGTSEDHKTGFLDINFIV